MKTMQSVAKTILQQIGHKSLYMIGAKNFIGSDNGLSFKIERNCKSISHIQIKLNGLDLYDMTFLRVRMCEAKTLSVVENVYFEQLNQIIKSETGLNTNL